MEIRRKVKNVVYKYSEPERLVREATSNDPWGPTSTVMAEIADLTYDSSSFEEIMSIIWRRLNDKGKNWRHVYKCLVLLEYLVKGGSDAVATVCVSQIHNIETLKDFQYYEEHRDLGAGVRERSKGLVELLKGGSGGRLKEERERGRQVRERFRGNKSALGSTEGRGRRPGDLGKEIRHNKEVRFPKSVMKLNFDETKNNDDDEENDPDLQRAIALSKEEHEIAMKKKETDERREDMKIKMALEESKKEDEALSVLRLPPKTQSNVASLDLLSLSLDNDDTSQKKKTLSKMYEASRVLEEMNGFGELEEVYNSDPWGSPTVDNTARASLTLDFDPWKTEPTTTTTTNTTVILGNKSNTNSAWLNKQNIIDDIFGEDKPSIKFDANWSSDTPNGVHNGSIEKENQLLDIWMTEPSDKFNSSKRNTGSLASLTDIGISSPQEEKMQHSCSVMNLAATNRTKMTPQDFLGENAKLVNFDNLLPTPKAAQKNPFGLSTGVVNNPFNNQNIQIKKPMNQMTPGTLHNNHMFTSSGNINSNNINANFNSFSQHQPIIANSQSQYHGFPTYNNPSYTTMPGVWTQQPPIVPSNQWAVPSNNATSNPFFN